MVHEVLAPGVQDGDEADPSTQVFGVVREFQERLGYRAEQEVIQDPLVHDGQGIELGGDGEDHVEVLHRQEVLCSCLYPLLLAEGLALGAVAVPAGVVGDLDMAAVLAPVLVPAKSCRPAGLDGAHGAQVVARQWMGVSVLRAVPAEDIRHLDAARGPHQGLSLRTATALRVWYPGGW